MKHVMHGKGVTSPGGIHCTCCTKGKPKLVKMLTARYNRKKAKKALANYGK
jgi:hypothetical protein